uniref:Uncharacterized protein n=1 Tax=Meloidogyne enterolobii TaxID=390850 RepID=A0A6V7VQ35_MELEN|nr:unnamed protein product [Meloidogyne enterolobii]
MYRFLTKILNYRNQLSSLKRDIKQNIRDNKYEIKSKLGGIKYEPYDIKTEIFHIKIKLQTFIFLSIYFTGFFGDSVLKKLKNLKI